MGFIDRRGRKKPLIYGHSYGVESVIDALDGMAERLREIPGAGQAIAEVAAPLLLAENQRTANAGQDSHGEPWEPTKAGGRPLRNAAAAIRVVAQGPRIAISLVGIEVAHHIGWARGYRGGTEIRRPIIPEKSSGSGVPIPQGIPPKWIEILRGVAAGEIGIELG